LEKQFYYDVFLSKLLKEGVKLKGVFGLKKSLLTIILLYAVYGLVLYFYLFFWTGYELPKGIEGTAADPKTFLTTEELQLSENYSQLKNLLFFISIPLEWIIFFIVLSFGISKTFQQWAETASRFFIVQTALYYFWLSLLVTLLTLPVSWLNYKLSKDFQISTQTLNSWLKDEVTDFLVNYVLMAVVVTFLYIIIRKFEKRWWLWAWFASIPFTLFIMFIQPVIIDPLYNDFYPLKNKKLEEEILQLASKADIPAEHVYEVDMSTKTNALNAYVTGIGSNSRIVLWDTTLNKLSEDEILFIMAHEMGHYVMKHIYIGIAGYLLLSLAGLYIIHRLMIFCTNRWGKRLNIQSIRELSSLPLFLLLLGMLSFASSPISGIVSRYQEKQADLYAIEMTKNEEAAVKTFQHLAKFSRSEINPPKIVKFLRYDHPPLIERIMYIENIKNKE
jgi:Zn-dependent protease with chaperone function